MTTSRYKDTKDPCPVFDGRTWHIFGSGGDVRTEQWKILHATTTSLTDSWIEHEPINFIGLEGERLAAPGVTFDEKERTFHMFIHTDFLTDGTSVEHLTSTDGKTFTKVATVLPSLLHTGEAALHDPHPALINNQKYLVYSGSPGVVAIENYFVSRPDIYLARSTTDKWAGPWEREGKILDHSDIHWHHNQHDHPLYEWGIEGAQLLELPTPDPTSPLILLNATCFLPHGTYGTRQRVFFAVSDNPRGPFVSLGEILSPLPGWESGENGHATCVIEGDSLHLFYQARSKENTEDVLSNNWRYGLAQFKLETLIPLLREYMSLAAKG